MFLVQSTESLHPSLQELHGTVHEVRETVHEMSAAIATHEKRWEKVRRATLAAIQAFAEDDGETDEETE